jgi:hypothetical protein
LTKIDVKVYPNPTNDNFRIESVVEIENVSIYSLDGKLMKTIPYSNGEKIDISNYNAGIYLVKVASEGRFNTIRIVKQ